MGEFTNSQKVIYRLTADFVVVIHLAFILFAVLGGLLVLRYRRFALLHLPALVWAVLISLAGWVCPLTPLEKWLRERAGLVSYDTTFIERYLLPIIYPGELTRGIQIFLGLLLLVLNLGIYGCIACRILKTKGRSPKALLRRSHLRNLRRVGKLKQRISTWTELI